MRKIVSSSALRYVQTGSLARIVYEESGFEYCSWCGNRDRLPASLEGRSIVIASISTSSINVEKLRIFVGICGQRLKSLDTTSLPFIVSGLSVLCPRICNSNQLTHSLTCSHSLALSLIRIRSPGRICRISLLPFRSDCAIIPVFNCIIASGAFSSALTVIHRRILPQIRTGGWMEDSD